MIAEQDQSPMTCNHDHIIATHHIRPGVIRAAPAGLDGGVTWYSNHVTWRYGFNGLKTSHVGLPVRLRRERILHESNLDIFFTYTTT